MSINNITVVTNSTKFGELIEIREVSAVTLTYIYIERYRAARTRVQQGTRRNKFGICGIHQHRKRLF